MDLDDVLLLVITTAILFVGIVIAVMQSKILRLLSKEARAENETKEVNRDRESKPEIRKQNIAKARSSTGLIRGEARLLGLDNEEHAAAIMAAVSCASNIPLEALKIKSIRKIEG